MSASGALVSNLEEADDLTATLASCWDAFEFIQQTASAYAVVGSARCYAFLYALAAACEGRDAVGTAPSMPAGAGTTASVPDPDTTGVDEVAALLTRLAEQIYSKLTTATTLPVHAADREAVLQAAKSAAEIRGLLGRQ